MENLVIKTNFTMLFVGKFDEDNDLEIQIENGISEINDYYNADQVNQLITHLSEQLTKIGVQVDILKDKNI